MNEADRIRRRARKRRAAERRRANRGEQKRPQTYTDQSHLSSIPYGDQTGGEREHPMTPQEEEYLRRLADPDDVHERWRRGTVNR